MDTKRTSLKRNDLKELTDIITLGFKQEFVSGFGKK